jgi:hypothetical protein
MNVNAEKKISTSQIGISLCLIFLFIFFQACDESGRDGKTSKINANNQNTTANIVEAHFSSPESRDTTAGNETTWYQEKDTISADSLARLHRRYARLKNTIKQRRDQFREEYNQANSDSARTIILQKAGGYLTQQLTGEVFPAWYGTDWDFNGYTNKPNDGVVACGYFVSTPLRHVGVNLNRYKVAQQYSTAIVEILCNESKTFTDLEKMLNHVTNRPDDLYIVGLTNHVGFIHKSGEEVYFVHANYLPPVAVVKEKVQSSEALDYSNIYVLGALTSSQDFIKKWLFNEVILVKS